MVLCRHREHIKITALPEAVDGCEECLAAGLPWLHLRICLECGHVGCCDDSPHRHATAHANASGHPIIRSLQPGEEWSWCYIDRIGMLTPEVSGSTRIPHRPSPDPTPREGFTVFDHVTLRVPDLAAADQRFEAVLATVGIDKSSRTESFAVWTNFALTQADDEHPVTTRLHVAFVAPSQEEVHDFWQAGVVAGFRDDGPPGPRAHYSADYYAAFLRDARDNSIEAVHRQAERPAGIIEHLVIRVADLSAATTFYRTISAAAGFDVRHESANRSTFAGPSGGAFSLVPGTPTENLHVAFPGTDDAVRRFHDDAVAAGYRGNGEPGERPQYHAGYYAAYVLDPDGNNIEVVNHHRP